MVILKCTVIKETLKGNPQGNSGSCGALHISVKVWTHVIRSDRL